MRVESRKLDQRAGHSPAAFTSQLSPVGLLSFFQPRPESSSAVPERWRKGNFTAFAAGEDSHFVCTREGSPFRVPSFAVDFVFGCLKFLPIETHLAEHAARHGWSGLERQALGSWLPRMIEGGLLVSSAQLRKQCAATHGIETPPPIAAIGFPTGGNRLPMITRAIESFAANLREHGRSADLLVADSSAPRADFREQIAEFARAAGARVLYAGEEEKRRFMDTLVRRGGCERAALEFALFDPLGTGFACGANRNAILLEAAGRMCCSVDDDVVCRLAAAPPSDGQTRPSALSLFSSCDPLSRSLFADRQSALEAGNYVARDFLAAHETMLGRELGALFDDTQLDLEQAGDELLQRLSAGPARIRTTFVGHLGDPGIPTSIYFLYYQGANRRRLTESEAHYRAALGSRSVLACVKNAAIGDASVCPGMAMGLDHRELLPPFFPVLHAEDFVFGATVWQCCPRSVAGHLPLAVVHDPPAGQPIMLPGDLSRDRRAVLFEFAHLMRSTILHHIPAEHAGTAARTISLGRHLSEIAAMPARDFIHELRQRTLAQHSEHIEWMAAQLKEDTDSPDFWRRDVEAYLDHAREAVEFEDFDIPFDLKPGRTSEESRALMQRLFAEFGRLLQAWPAIVSAAKEAKESGERPLFAER